jgi:pantetheine-phosphate adenylyltransferase
MKTCICPGSFDPVTNGHIDIIERASALWDKVIVAVGQNISKKCVFTIEERIDFLKCALAHNPKVEIESFDGLLIEFAKKKGAAAIIKGLRAVSDFEYEFQMALLNKSLDHNIETLFMMTSVNYSYLSSSAVREIAKNGGNINGLVPDCIIDKISEIIKRKNGGSIKA